MGKRSVSLKALLLGGLLVAIMALESEGDMFGYDFKPLPPPNQYGNFLLNRTSEKNNVKPAIFSHWIHRQKHTCRVCHFELDFRFKVNTTEITEAENKEGKYCGAATCHDGKAVFGHTKENCDKCHNGNISDGRDKFWPFMKKVPKAKFGNEVDWVKAVDNGTLNPVKVLTRQPPKDLKFTKNLELESEAAFISPSAFPHDKHAEWLDCNNCHPDIFRMKKKADRFDMADMIKGKYCGLCHSTVAFPMNDCQRCHKGMSLNY